MGVKFNNEDEFVAAMKERNPDVWLIDNLYTDIIARISARRNDLDWSQEELAKKSGLKQSAIARLEMCSNMPRLDTLLKVVIALGLELELKATDELINRVVELHEWKKEKTAQYTWEKQMHEGELNVIGCVKSGA